MSEQKLVRVVLRLLLWTLLFSCGTSMPGTLIFICKSVCRIRTLHTQISGPQYFECMHICNGQLAGYHRTTNLLKGLHACD